MSLEKDPQDLAPPNPNVEACIDLIGRLGSTLYRIPGRITKSLGDFLNDLGIFEEEAESEGEY